MSSNQKYQYFIPDGVKPMSLSRDFLLTVRNNINILLQLIAYNDPDLYRELYTISKIEISKRNGNRWKDFEMPVDIDIVDKIRNFVPIEG